MTTPKISLIVCSRRSDISDTLRENVATTIGTADYEWVCIDNSANKYSIFEAYNLGISRAKGEVLCFMHDDIEYRSTGWGDVVIRCLQADTADACAVIGNKYARKAPSYTGSRGFACLQYIDEKRGLLADYDASLEQGGNSIILFDGMWFCLHRRCLERVHFDEGYKGFHFYDMDTAMQLFTSGFRTVFTPDILIWHRSGGQFDRVFLENSYRYYRKWHRMLPATSAGCTPPSRRQTLYFELEAIYTSLRQIILYRCWHLLPRFYTMVWETAHMPCVIALVLAIIHHQRVRGQQEL